MQNKASYGIRIILENSKFEIMQIITVINIETVNSFVGCSLLNSGKVV